MHYFLKVHESHAVSFLPVLLKSVTYVYLHWSHECIYQEAHTDCRLMLPFALKLNFHWHSFSGQSSTSSANSGQSCQALRRKVFVQVPAKSEPILQNPETALVTKYTVSSKFTLNSRCPRFWTKMAFFFYTQFFSDEDRLWIKNLLPSINSKTLLTRRHCQY